MWLHACTLLLADTGLTKVMKTNPACLGTMAEWYHVWPMSVHVWTSRSHWRLYQPAEIQLCSGRFTPCRTLQRHAKACALFQCQKQVSMGHEAYLDVHAA